MLMKCCALSRIRAASMQELHDFEKAININVFVQKSSVTSRELVRFSADKQSDNQSKKTQHAGENLDNQNLNE